MHVSKNKLTKTSTDQTIIDALGSQLKVATTITLNGETYKVKDLQQQFQSEVVAAKATQSAKTAYAQAVLAEKKVAAQVTLLRKALRTYLIATYGAKSAIVASFGFTPKDTTVTVATKADAIVKRVATKAARGTKAASSPVAAAANGTTPKAAATN
jgi:hypothetical protein